jgi:hypothetical protein
MRVGTLEITDSNQSECISSQAEAPPIANFRDIVNAVRNKQCMLFLGAGVHYPPPACSPYAHTYPEEVRPPLGTALTGILAEDSEIAADRNFSEQERGEIAGNLQRISLYYEKKKGRQALVAKVRAAVTDGKDPSRAVRALAALDFPVICTTNYDRLFETALILESRKPVVSSYSNYEYAVTKDFLERDVDPKSPFLFKIHGDIDDPTGSIVITDEDYIHFIMRMITGTRQHDPIPLFFHFSVKSMPILFIGFSLMDYNLRLLFKLLGWEGNNAVVQHSYSVGPYPDGLIRSTYDPPVQFIVHDLWKFVPALYYAVTGEVMP